MESFRKIGFSLGAVFVMVVMMLGVVSCASSQLPKGMVGRLGRYDYSPSVIQSGNTRQFWWCGQAHNPADSSQDSDAILYESVNLVTGETTGPLTVLAETPHAWDSVYTCNPKVIEGTFNNPLNDGKTYTYALYYVGINDGSTNNLGVAFSNDGIAWKKYPQPVITPGSLIGYGVGQPALYNTDHKAGITMFYEESNSTTSHIKATSSDGVHFTVQGTLTTNGLSPDCTDASWGDMAYDAKTGYWYAAFNLPLRDPSTTGGVTERGQLGVELYRIPDSALLTGSTPWQQLGTIDSNATGFESNFLAGFVRDPYGTVNVGAYPSIQLYVSVSDPRPSWDASPKDAASSAGPDSWDIAPFEWVPNQPPKSFAQYFNDSVHMATTGWSLPSGGFRQESVLGHLYEAPGQGANVPFYACVSGQKDFFVSLDSACEGKRVLGKNGYGYSGPVSGLNLVALYRCSTGRDHFVSNDPKCHGETTDKFLGYVVP